MKYVQTSKDGKVYVDQQSVKAEITDVMFDIEDKKVVTKLRGILKAWTAADTHSRKAYNDAQDNDESI